MYVIIVFFYDTFFFFRFFINLKNFYFISFLRSYREIKQRIKNSTFHLYMKTVDESPRPATSPDLESRLSGCSLVDLAGRERPHPNALFRVTPPLFVSRWFPGRCHSIRYPEGSDEVFGRFSFRSALSDFPLHFPDSRAREFPTGRYGIMDYYHERIVEFFSVPCNPTMRI